MGTDYELYTEQLGFYFLANGVTEAKTKKSVLLTNLSVETYQLAKNLVAPTQLKDDTLMYNVIGKRIQKPLKPERSALVARYEFDNRAGSSGESVSYHVAILKHLAAECKFGEAMRTERLRDRVLSSIRDSKMITEILKVIQADLSFDLAVQKCLEIVKNLFLCFSDSFLKYICIYSFTLGTALWQVIFSHVLRPSEVARYLPSAMREWRESVCLLVTMNLS